MSRPKNPALKSMKKEDIISQVLYPIIEAARDEAAGLVAAKAEEYREEMGDVGDDDPSLLLYISEQLGDVTRAVATIEVEDMSKQEISFDFIGKTHVLKLSIPRGQS